MEVLIRNVRLAFADGLFNAKAVEAGGTPKFAIKAILPKDHPQLDELRAIEQQVAEEKWGKKAPDILKRLRAAEDKHLLRDGTTQRADGFDGMLFVSASSEERPTLWDRKRNPVVKDDGLIYSGCYVNLKVEVWAQDNQWGQRINAQLCGAQFVADGDAFSAGARPADADDFPDLEAGDAEDPFA